MTEAQSNGRESGAADIRRSGRLSVYELFAARAKRDPHAVAIEQGNLRRSYGELNERVILINSGPELARFKFDPIGRCANSSRLRAQAALPPSTIKSFQV